MVDVGCRGPGEAPGGPIFELHEYLAALDEESDRPVDVTVCFPDRRQLRVWEAKTRVVIGEMVAYLHWLVTSLAERPGLVLVPLLRDALLPYFGITLLRRRGVELATPRPALFNRQLTALFDHSKAPRDALYLDLAHLFFRALLDHRPGDPGSLRRVLPQQPPPAQ